jgi:hypothetical protein
MNLVLLPIFKLLSIPVVCTNFQGRLETNTLFSASGVDQGHSSIRRSLECSFVLSVDTDLVHLVPRKWLSTVGTMHALTFLNCAFKFKLKNVHRTRRTVDEV